MKRLPLLASQPQTLNFIWFGAPKIGSSTDGQTFREVGKHVFPLAKATRASIAFPDTEAQHIRLTYLEPPRPARRQFPEHLRLHQRGGGVSGEVISNHMSLLYQLRCPQCNKPTTLSVAGSCLNRMRKNNQVCGYKFTWVDPQTRNSTQCEKQLKHTNPPSIFPSEDTVSWCDSPVAYHQHQTGVSVSGSIHLDPTWNYLFLWSTPKGTEPVGTLLLAQDSMFRDVSGVKMPLNSRPNDLHIHFDNYQEEFVKVCDFKPDLTIRFPSYGQDSFFQVLSEGRSIFTFDPSSSLYRFD